MNIVMQFNHKIKQKLTLFLFNRVNKKKGFVLVTMVLLAFSLVIGIISNLFHVTAPNDNDFISYLNDSQNKLLNWYESNPSLVDYIANDGTFNEFKDDNGCQTPVILKLAGIQPKYNIGLSLSNPIMNISNNIQGGEISFRRLAVFIPSPSDYVSDECPSSGEIYAPRMDKTTGGFIPREGDIYKIIEGQSIEQKNYLNTLEKMKKISFSLENRFAAKLAADPNGARMSNWFRTIDCGDAATGRTLEPQCTDSINNPTIIVKPDPVPTGFSQATVANNFLNLKDTLTVTDNDLVDGWGKSIYFCNSPECSNAMTMPFSLVMLSRTPWNTTILFTAIQK
jgi:hypothetical protein